jgi:hypothetical protein
VSTKADRINSFARKQALVRAKDLKTLSVSRSYLWNLTKGGQLERVGRGLYRHKDTAISEYETLLEVSKMVPLAVLCLSSALRYHELTTENPFEIWIAIERGAWTPKLDYLSIRTVHFSKAAFEFGIETHSQVGNSGYTVPRKRSPIVSNSDQRLERKQQLNPFGTVFARRKPRLMNSGKPQRSAELRM